MQSVYFYERLKSSDVFLKRDFSLRFYETFTKKKMREFGGNQIPSDEYRLMYEHAAQENEHLKYKDSVQKLEIAALWKKLLALEQHLESKDEKIEQLEIELKEQKCETKQFEDKFEIQALKTERAHQVRMEAEDKVVQLRRMVGNLKSDIGKCDFARTILIKQRSTLEKKVKEQDSALKQSAFDNEKLIAKVADLKDLCKRAEKRIDADDIKIAKLNDTVASQKASLDLRDLFAASVEKRDAKIKSCLDQIVDHYERKSNSRCFFITKRQRKNRGFSLIEELKHVVDVDVEADGIPSGDPDDRQLM